MKYSWNRAEENMGSAIDLALEKLFSGRRTGKHNGIQWRFALIILQDLNVRKNERIREENDLNRSYNVCVRKSTDVMGIVRNRYTIN